MAERPDDKNASWREKYLDALDEHDKLEKSYAAQMELLRRALVRVSVAADGQDDALDAVLAQLRDQLRGAVSGNVQTLFTKLDEVALGFDQHREQNALDVRQALGEMLKSLQALELSRGVKKHIQQYLNKLPERARSVRLYPALLKELAEIQAAAVKEVAQPKKGFLEKLLGNKEKGDDKEKGDSKESPENAPTLESSLANIPLVDNPATGALTGVSLVDAAPVVLASIPLVDTSPHRAGLQQILPPAFAEKVIEVIEHFLTSLEKETPLIKKAKAIRERMSPNMRAQDFVLALENLRDLVMSAYLAANKAFAAYLAQVNAELAEIYVLIGGAQEQDKVRVAASQLLQKTVRSDMSLLEQQTDEATDLAQLKSQVKSQIGNIRHALDQHQQAEDQAAQLSRQLEALGNKIKAMEEEAQKNHQVLEKHRHKALHDALTDLPNREYYNERAAHEFQRWHRYKHPLTVAVFDIDFFKRINDTYGHQAGDRVLKVIGKSIAKRLREVDFFCRFGGEEFVALLPDTELNDALQVLEKIRAAIANASFNYKDQPITITLSIGVTNLKEGDDLETAFARADEALYAAKQEGRNRVKSA